MATKRLRPVHPGDILLHDFMQPLKVSSYKLAKEPGVTAPSINEIVRRRRAVSAEMALRLSRYFGASAQLWLNLQSQYDLEVAESERRLSERSTPMPALTFPIRFRRKLAQATPTQLSATVPQRRGRKPTPMRSL
jgi:antitoxin HigA-1